MRRNYTKSGYMQLRPIGAFIEGTKDGRAEDTPWYEPCYHLHPFTYLPNSGAKVRRHF